MTRLPVVHKRNLTRLPRLFLQKNDTLLHEIDSGWTILAAYSPLYVRWSGEYVVVTFICNQWSNKLLLMTQHRFGQQLVAEGNMGITWQPLAIAGLHQ